MLDGIAEMRWQSTRSFRHTATVWNGVKAVRGYHRGLEVSMLYLPVHHKPFGLGAVLLR